MENEKDHIVISSIEFSDFSGFDINKPKVTLNLSEDLIRLAELQLKITAVLGTRRATVGEVNEYKVGDIIEVERLAGHNVDIYIGSEKIAIGEIVPMENNFALIINEIVSKNGDFLKHISKNGEVV